MKIQFNKPGLAQAALNFIMFLFCSFLCRAFVMVFVLVLFLCWSWFLTFGFGILVLVSYFGFVLLLFQPQITLSLIFA